MSTLHAQIGEKAIRLRVAFSVHLDLTWRCNENCIHCYLEHASPGELSTSEVKDVLTQLAAAGTFFLCLSGGEVFLRTDLFDIVAHARSLLFNVTLKTNGLLLGEPEVRRLADLCVSQVHISLYSHRPEVHDAITRVPGSFERSLAALRLLKEHGIHARLSNVVMQANFADYPHVQALANDLGIENKVDATVSPAYDGNPAPSALRVSIDDLRRMFRDPGVVQDVDKFCAPPAEPDAEKLDALLCGAGHSSCYISPTGDVLPCVQFPIVCGNLRQSKFAGVWRESPDLARIRALRTRDLPVCRTCANVVGCSRCPGLAYMQGDLLGPSLIDCEKAHARTGLPTPVLCSGS